MRADFLVRFLILLGIVVVAGTICSLALWQR
jgi:hypothetical protein